MSGRHAGAGAAGRRPFSLLLPIAAVLGVSIGLRAPDVSPVAPPVPLVQVQPADDGAGPPQDVRGPRR